MKLIYIAHIIKTYKEEAECNKNDEEVFDVMQSYVVKG